MELGKAGGRMFTVQRRAPSASCFSAELKLASWFDVGRLVACGLNALLVLASYRLAGACQVLLSWVG